ncbi:MAG: sugar phosphate isomerase/epimerase [Verrucomicrobia bacterium]|nr:sugar phosphate isomerase/epimerase [Verrucomicrobiota bacterium]
MRTLSRRRFLDTASRAALLAATSSVVLPSIADAVSVKPVVGSQLYGWGQYYDRDGKNIDAHIDDVLRALRDSGYDYAESSLDTGTPDNNARFADRLRSRGLRPVSLYTGGSFHTAAGGARTIESVLSAAKIARKAGFEVIVCNPDAIGRDKTDDELKIQSLALNQLGEKLRALGLRFGIHHHTPEMRREAKEFHYNFQHGAEGTVDFCYDVHWVYRGGVSPAKALELYGRRVVSWHLRQSRDQVWWEDLDGGDVNYPEIAKTVKAQRIPRRFTVELAIEAGTKITRTAVENHRRSRDYVRQVFGV